MNFNKFGEERRKNILEKLGGFSQRKGEVALFSLKCKLERLASGMQSRAEEITCSELRQQIIYF